MQGCVIKKSAPLALRQHNRSVRLTIRRNKTLCCDGSSILEEQEEKAPASSWMPLLPMLLPLKYKQVRAPAPPLKAPACVHIEPFSGGKLLAYLHIPFPAHMHTARAG